jgi:hypothetical protein
MANRPITMVNALRVTHASIRFVGNIKPAFQFTGEESLKSLGFDGAMVKDLKEVVKDSKSVGLPSLTPRFTININLLNISTSSTVNGVFLKVNDNAIEEKI